jgi:hypothetical protein
MLNFFRRRTPRPAPLSHEACKLQFRLGLLECLLALVEKFPQVQAAIIGEVAELKRELTTNNSQA